MFILSYTIYCDVTHADGSRDCCTCYALVGIARRTKYVLYLGAYLYCYVFFIIK